MSQISRTKNSAKNVVIASIVQIITIIVSFVARTIFIKLMNADYLGVNGLFNNVLAILAFSELGISSAIIYNMYKPVADGDNEQIAALLNFYKKAYRIVASFIFVVGLLITPFIGYLINETPDIRENLQIIYLLFLLNTVSSYLFSYSRSIFTANQKDYINVLVERIFWIVMYFLQLVYLYLTHDFYGYLIFMTCATLASDISITLYSKIKYPQITKNKAAKLSSFNVKKILKDIYALFAYKVGSVLLQSTSNIVIAKLINITVVGICSNYILITSSIETILQKVLNSIVASIGNLNATDDNENQKKVLYELTLCTNWIYGFCSIMLFILINQLIEMWLGNDYLLTDSFVVLAVVLSFFFFGTNFTISSYRTTMGIFRQARYVPMCAACVNLLLSIVLGKAFGLVGIYISISITRLFTFNSIDPYLVFKKAFNESVIPYYLYQLKFYFVTVIVGYICYITSMQLPNTFMWFMLKLVLFTFVINLSYVLVYYSTDQFKSLIKRLSILKR